MKENPLGKTVRYPEHYDPQLLLALPRAVNRKVLGIDSKTLPFCGADIWNAYELSWLNPAGKPQAGRGRFIFPCTSPNLVESKSLKLYLNSLNQHRFSDFEAARNCIRQDLGTVAGAAVEVLVQPFGGMKEFLEVPEGICLDKLNVSCEQFETDAELLFLAGAGDMFDAVVDEIVYTDLFRSRCPMTGQPDWATITVCYQGSQIDHAALFRYLMSYRLHHDYHENCVERIYCDIMEKCHPQSLSVEANFLRRGGLDINPVRSTTEAMDYVLFPRFNRQ